MSSDRQSSITWSVPKHENGYIRESRLSIPRYTGIVQIGGLPYPRFRSDDRFGIISRVEHRPTDRHIGKVAIHGGPVCTTVTGDPDIVDAIIGKGDDDIAFVGAEFYGRKIST